MKKSNNEKIQALHDNLEKNKDDILKEREEGRSITNLSKKYGINLATIGDWIYFWQNGIKRQKNIARTKKRMKEKAKRVFSPELLAKMKINTEINKRLIKHIKVDNGSDTQMIRFICGV